MSKMGTLNLELQEQANMLGYSTVQEALDNGYAIGPTNELVSDEQAKAHEAWLEEKNSLLKELKEIQGYFEAMGYPENYRPNQMGKTIARTIKFIEEGEA